MKPRKVVIIMEVETDETLEYLRFKAYYECFAANLHTCKILKIQAKVKEGKK